MSDPMTYINRQFIDYLSHNPGVYLEVRNGSLLLFRPDQSLLRSDDVMALLSVVTLFYRRDNDESR